VGARQENSSRNQKRGCDGMIRGEGGGGGGGEERGVGAHEDETL